MATRSRHSALTDRWRIRVGVALAIGLASGCPAHGQSLPPEVLPGTEPASEAARAAPVAPAAPAEPAAPVTPATEGGNAAAHARALVRALEGDASRAGLVEELKKIAGEEPRPEQAPPAGGPAAPDATAPQDDRPPGGPAVAAQAPPIADRLTAAITGIVSDLLGDARDAWNELRATARHLRGFSRLDAAEFARILRGVAPVATVAVAGGVLARRAMLPVFRRMGAAADRARVVRTAVIALGGLLLDFVTVLLGAAAGFAVLGLIGTDDQKLRTFQATFLVSFVVTGLLLVVVRALFSPATPHLRPLPVNDAAARHWTSRIGVIVILLAFGELFVRALVAETTSPITARATLLTIYVVIGLYLIGLILANRQAPAAYFERRAAENEDDLTFSILAAVMRYWHYIAIAFVLALTHQVLTSSSGALRLAFAAAEILAAFAVGAFLVALMSGLGREGIRLPARLNRAMPAMQNRINAFVPAFLRLFRFLVLVAWTTYSLQVVGVLDFGAWLERRIGVDLLDAAASVLLTLLVGFVVWLALTSWIDYRIAPRRGLFPTSRERTLLSLLRNAATVVIVLTGLMFTLSALGISIAPLIASAGVLGLAIGFGAQRMVEDIIGGVIIQLENAVNVGDIVQAAGTTGEVERLTIRSLGLRDLQGVYHVIPFSAVTTVSNFTKGFSHHIADIGIAHCENIDEAKAAMLAAYDDLKADGELGPKLIGEIEWFGVERLGDSSVVLRARLKTWPGDQWALGRAYNERVKKRFAAAGVQIALPQLTLWFGEDKEGNAPPARLAPRERGAARHRAAPSPPPETRKAPIRPGSPTDADTDAEGSVDGENGL
jgi:moderate conductance mechanosensitive channel